MANLGTSPAAVLLHELEPVVVLLAGKGTQDIGDDAINMLDLAGGFVTTL